MYDCLHSKHDVEGVGLYQGASNLPWFHRLASCSRLGGLDEVDDLLFLYSLFFLEISTVYLEFPEIHIRCYHFQKACLLEELSSESGSQVHDDCLRVLEVFLGSFVEESYTSI